MKDRLEYGSFVILTNQDTEGMKDIDDGQKAFIKENFKSLMEHQLNETFREEFNIDKIPHDQDQLDAYIKKESEYAADVYMKSFEEHCEK